MKHTPCSFLLIMLSLSFGTYAQSPLKSHNLAPQYNPESEVGLKCEFIEQGDSLNIYLRLSINQNKPQIDDYVFNLYTTSDYTEKLKKIAEEKIDSAYLGVADGKYILQFNTPTSEISSLIVVQLQSKFSGFTYYFDFPSANYPLALSNIDGTIQFDPWLSPGVYNFNDSTKHLTGYYYQHEFPPALPPMPIKKDVPERSLTIDSTFYSDGNENSWFTKPGLYLIQRDTSDRNGYSFRVETKHYPKLAKLEDLVKPLIYITTKEENKMLQDVEGDKKAFDRFWLELADSPERAKNIIKYYFDRVEQANQYFTTYKEGWKTDMGMIYIIFGPPDEVKKTVEGQSWHYLALPQLPGLQFNFIKTETVFSTPHYVLIRERKYANAWYKTIDLWRKGRF
ncbi:MAG: GWxTD domain-containing protein [Fulvivirga sp.]